MKRIFFVLICTMLLLVGCANTNNDADKTEKVEKAERYVIPGSFITFSNSTIDSFVDVYTELGPDYCDSVTAEGQDAIVMMTPTQRKNMIDRNNEYMDSMTKTYRETEEGYYYEEDSDYKELKFYFDEKIDFFTMSKAIDVSTMTYAFNQILLDKTTDWEVDCSIYNIHTGKKIVEFSIPEEGFSINAEDWEKSYEDTDEQIDSEADTQ